MSARVTPGAWRPGNRDSLSYDIEGGGPYKVIYVDAPDPKAAPLVLAKAYGNEDECRANARLMAESKVMYGLLAEIFEVEPPAGTWDPDHVIGILKRWRAVVIRVDAEVRP